MATWQFVADMASASPSVLLDLNTTGLRVGRDWNLDPPQYEKGRAGGALRHGQPITRSVAANRILTIPLEINQASANAAATVIENLGRQLAVDNILKVQFGSTPVFFRTYADPAYAAEVRGVLTQDTSVTLQIEAEPFAYGPRVEVAGSPFTVSNDPAAGTNPCHFDVTGVLGDVASPLLLHATSTGASGTPSGLVSKWTHIGVRRRGIPSGYSNVVQAEGMLMMSADTTVIADGTMSGGSKIRTTFATSTALTLRAQDQFPANNVATVEARGEYVVYGRFAKTNASDVINVQFRYGTGGVNHVANDAVQLPLVAGPMTVNLGKFPVPTYSDPVTHGFSGVPLKALVSWIGFYAQRISGSGSLDCDYLYCVPADDSTLIVRFPGTDTTYAIDGTTDAGGSVYALNAVMDEITTTATPPQIVGGGGFPEVIPGQTNRIHFLRHVDPSGSVDALTNTTTIRAYYWPRWRGYSRS